MNNCFIILAAGESKRFNSRVPKPYFIYRNKPLLLHSIDRAKYFNKFNKILVVINKKHINLIKKLKIKKIKIIVGGKTRAESALKALKSISYNNQVTIINSVRNIKEFSCITTSNNAETMKILSENEIYFHASNFETVGLPLYEAQELGLKVVAPSSPYTQYFDKDSTFLYESNNINDAVEKINLAIESKSENIKALNYSENWAKVIGLI